MATSQFTKAQVLRALKIAAFVSCQAVGTCITAENASGPIKAFSTVASVLPTVRDAFQSMKTYLESHEGETEQTTKGYPAIEHAAKDCCTQIGSLERLFDIVNQDLDNGTKVERYTTAVRKGNGKKVEDIMLELLTNINVAAVDPFVSQDQITALKNALEEVKKIPPSVPEGHGLGTTMNNYGQGSQFCHSGHGDQHHVTGGISITGKNDNAKYLFSTQKEENNKEVSLG